MKNLKRTLFWITIPFMFILFVLSSFLGALCEGCTETCHLWEGWCLDYKNKYQGMHYKGDGVWSSFKE